MTTSPSPSSAGSSTRFHPRPFPPPSLAHVPIEYIIDQLRNLALHYWNKPETADCTIVIPVPHPRRQAKPSPPCPPLPSAATSTGRRVTEPAITSNTLPRIVFKVHLDYLTSQSTLLRGVFSGTSVMDLLTSTAPSPISPTKLQVPPNRLPRLLPSPPHHPTLYLPVPDPSSIALLFQYLYFGSPDSIQEALDTGKAQWEGVARNVEYLGMGMEIKVFLGRYYRAWLHPEQRGQPCGYDFDDDDGDDDDGMDSDSDSDDSGYDTCLSDLEDDEDDRVVHAAHVVEKKGLDGLTLTTANAVIPSSSSASPQSVTDDDDQEDEELPPDETLGEDFLWSGRGRSRATRCLSASYVPDSIDELPLYLGENKRWSA